MNLIAEAYTMVISKIDNRETKIANDDKTTPVSKTKRKRLQGKTTTESDCESPEACLDSDTIVYSHLLAVPEIKEALSKFENVGARRESVNRKYFADSTSIWLDLVNQLESEYHTVKGVLAQLVLDYPVLSRHPVFAAVVAEGIDATKPNGGYAEINSMKTNEFTSGLVPVTTRSVREEMQTSKNDQFGWIFETESKDDLSDLFAGGEGILQFMPEMSDEAIVIAIRHALSISAGKPFLVMPG